MADTTSTESEVDTSVDTDDAAEKALEDVDINFDNAEEETEDSTESEESKDAQSDETDEDDESDSSEIDDKEESDDSQEETDESDASKQSDEDKRKAQAKEMFEKRQQEKAAKAKTQAEEQQAYLDEAEDNPEQLAIRQVQIEMYETRVESNEAKLKSGYDRAIEDFKILRNSDPYIQSELDDAVDAFQAKYVTIDKYGNPSQIAKGANLYEYLQKKADSLAKLTGLGTKTQKDNKAKEKSKTFTPPSRAPKTGKQDADMQAFLDEANS